MKKAILLMLVCVLCLTLCACTDSAIKDACEEYGLKNIEISCVQYKTLAEYKLYKAEIRCEGASVLDKEQMGMLFGLISRSATDYDKNNILQTEDITIYSDGHTYAYVGDESRKAVLTVDGETFLSKEALAELDTLNEMKDTVFASNDPVKFADYLKLFRKVAEYGKELETIAYFPYDEVANFVSNNFETVAIENNGDSFYNGYTSDRDESYWYDPLSQCKVSLAGVGCYKYTFATSCYGDLMTETETRYWYQTDKNDSNNKYNGKLYYKGHLVSSDYYGVNAFISYLSDKNVYGCVDESGDVTLIILLDGSFVIQQDRLFFINYD